MLGSVSARAGSLWMDSHGASTCRNSLPPFLEQLMYPPPPSGPSIKWSHGIRSVLILKKLMKSTSSVSNKDWWLFTFWVQAGLLKSTEKCLWSQSLWEEWLPCWSGKACRDQWWVNTLLLLLSQNKLHRFVVSYIKLEESSYMKSPLGPCFLGRSRHPAGLPILPVPAASPHPTHADGDHASLV